MNDIELELIYKSQLGTSHFAGLRAVFEAGVESVEMPVDESVPEVVEAA